MKDEAIIRKLAKSKTAANKLVKTVEVETIEKALRNLGTALEVNKTREQEREQKKKASAVKKLKNMMAELGISTEDILNESSPQNPLKEKPRSRAKALPKYALSRDGTTHQWTGRGRAPIVFREYLERGGSLESCLIKNS